MYYFSYGSNANIKHLCLFIDPSCFKIMGCAYIKNYKFVYRNVKCTKLRSGVANIEPSNGGKVYGILYQIKNSTNIKQLDKKEGFFGMNDPKNKYNKQKLKCYMTDFKKEYNCFTYVMNCKYKLEEKKPSKRYHLILNNCNNKSSKYKKQINYI